MRQLLDLPVYFGGGVYKSDFRDFAVLNTSSAIHRRYVAFTKAGEENYLNYEDGRFLSFNWVDTSKKYYSYHGPEAFIRALDFIDKYRNLGEEVYICCDQGESRSATMGLLYLTKRVKHLPDSSFAAAREGFLEIFSGYRTRGIADYVAEHWEEIT